MSLEVNDEIAGLGDVFPVCQTSSAYPHTYKILVGISEGSDRFGDLVVPVNLVVAFGWSRLQIVPQIRSGSCRSENFST